MVGYWLRKIVTSSGLPQLTGCARDRGEIIAHCEAADAHLEHGGNALLIEYAQAQGRVAYRRPTHRQGLPVERVPAEIAGTAKRAFRLAQHAKGYGSRRTLRTFRSTLRRYVTSAAPHPRVFPS